jgi:protein gp37
VFGPRLWGAFSSSDLKNAPWAGFFDRGSLRRRQEQVRWLSCEALIEPLRFQHLDRFNWIVIGGASKTSRTPKWAPPFTWIDDLVRQPRVARVKVYFKRNLFDGNARILEMPFYAPIEPDPAAAPAILHYLKGAAR